MTFKKIAHLFTGHITDQRTPVAQRNSRRIHEHTEIASGSLDNMRNRKHQWKIGGFKIRNTYGYFQKQINVVIVYVNTGKRIVDGNK